MRLTLPTSGSRMAVWAFPALSAYIGLCYLLMDRSRLGSPAFDVARELLPMRAWGAVFLALAVFKTAAFLSGSPRTFVLAMCLGAGLYATWSVFFLASAVSAPDVSLVAPAWPAFACFFHVAFLKTATAPR